MKLSSQLPYLPRFAARGRRLYSTQNMDAAFIIYIDLFCNTAEKNFHAAILYPDYRF